MTVEGKEDWMIKKVLIVTLCLVTIISLSTCKKKETQPPVPQTQGPIMPGQMPPEQMPPGQMPPGPITQGPVSQEGQQQFARPGMTMTKSQTKVIVPESVKGKWSAATIILEDKVSKTKHEYTVKLNSDFNIPNSDLKIHVGEFLPDFKMDGLTLTSSSNEPRNPALALRVFENGKQIFPAAGKQWGWLFSKVPSIHRFEHPRYAIILKEGVKKG
jgi:hypothetical protein